MEARPPSLESQVYLNGYKTEWLEDKDSSQVQTAKQCKCKRMFQGQLNTKLIILL